MPGGLYSVYVGNLSKFTSELELKNLFSKFGTPRRIYIAVQPDELLHTYGFVRFTMKESAIEAIVSMNGHMHHGKTMRVEFSSDNSPVDQLDTEIEDRLKGQKSKAVLEVEQANLRKIMHLKRAVCDFYKSRGSEKKATDITNILSGLQQLCVKLPAAAPDSNKQMVVHTEDDKQRSPSGRVSPLLCCQEVKDLNLPWLERSPIQAKNSNADAVLPQIKDQDSGPRKVEAHTTTVYHPSLQVEAHTTPAISATTPSPVLSRCQNMPDVVVDVGSLSSSSGYGSGSADEISVSTRSIKSRVEPLDTKPTNQDTTELKPSSAHRVGGRLSTHSTDKPKVLLDAPPSLESLPPPIAALAHQPNPLPQVHRIYPDYSTPRHHREKSLISSAILPADISGAKASSGRGRRLLDALGN